MTVWDVGVGVWVDNWVEEGVEVVAGVADVVL